METENVVRNTSESGRGFFVDTIIPGIITLVLCGIVIYIVRAFLIKSLRRKDNLEEKQKVRFVKTVTTILAIVAIVIVISGYGLQTGSLLALIGVVGLSLSLSVQGVLSSFFSGCVLPVTKPFREGDIIEAGGTRGIIERIGYLNTTIVTMDNITVVVPNSVLTSGSITNYSTRETLKVEASFSVDPSMADEDVRAALREAIGKDSRILTDPEPVIRIESFDSTNTAYNVKVSCKSKDYNEVSYALVENVYASFKEHSIEVGFGMMGILSGGQIGSQGRGGMQSGGMGGGMGRGQGGGMSRGQGMGEQQSGGAGSGQGGRGQPSVDAGSSQSGGGQPSGGAGSGRGGSGQPSGGAGSGRGGSGQPSGGQGSGRGGN